MEVAGHAHILSCSPLGVSTPLFDGLWAHIEPKSRPDRALSYTEMGTAPCGGRPAYGLATVSVPWTPAWGGHTRANARAYRGRRLRVDGPAARGVAPEVVARFTEPAARGCTASRPSAAAPAARA